MPLQNANKETGNSLEKTPENTKKTTKYKKGSQKFTSNEGICSKKVEENYKRKKEKLGTHQKRHKTPGKISKKNYKTQIRKPKTLYKRHKTQRMFSKSRRKRKTSGSSRKSHNARKGNRRLTRTMQSPRNVLQERIKEKKKRLVKKINYKTQKKKAKDSPKTAMQNPGNMLQEKKESVKTSNDDTNCDTNDDTKATPTIVQNNERRQSK